MRNNNWDLYKDDYKRYGWKAVFYDFTGSHVERFADFISRPFFRYSGWCSQKWWERKREVDDKHR